MQNHTKYGEPEKRQSRAKIAEIAWLAGIVDGEGCLYAGFNQRSDPNWAKMMKVNLRIGNCDLSLIEKSQKIILKVAGRKYKIHSQTNGMPNVLYTIDVENQRGIYLVCRVMLPYLTAKRKQAREMMRLLESRKRARHGDWKAKLTEREIRMVEKIRALKRSDLTPTQLGVSTERVAPANAG